MRASLTLIATAVLALTSSVAIASPVSLESSDVLAERSAALASSAEAVDARDVQDLESRRRHKKHHKKNKHPHHGNAKKGGNGVATWYTGGQVSCARQSATMARSSRHSHIPLPSSHTHR